MPKPNHLIEKPIIAVFIILNKFPKLKAKQPLDYMNKQDIDSVWVKIKDQLKDQNFLKQLETFDIRKVNTFQVMHI